MHVFLSPHLDDAILSCGGLIHQLAQRGQPVLILTLMAGDPPTPLPTSPLIEELHGRWGAGANPMPLRRQEDIAAAQVLKVDTQHLGFADCPYRVDAEGHALYLSSADLFGEIHPDDPLQAFNLALPSAAAVVYAPLGAGGHVDHRLVSRLAQQVPSSLALFYYEEYPYSAESGEAAKVSDPDEVRLTGSAAVQQALAQHLQPLEPQLVMLSDDDLEMKIEAIACYRSQLSTFWQDEHEMADGVRRYACAVHPAGAERLWRMKDSR